MKNIIFISTAAGPIKYFNIIIKSLIKENYIFCITSSIGRPYIELPEKDIYIINEDEYNENKTSYTSLLNHLVNSKLFDMAVVSAGWKSVLDKDLSIIFKQKGILVVNIIESWYVDRVFYNNKTLIADYLLVNDESAKQKCIDHGVIENKIHVLGNPVLETRWDNINSKNLNIKYKETTSFVDGKVILFISEDYSRAFPKGSENYQGFDEYYVVQDILKELNPNDKLYIKLHPMEDSTKYLYENILLVEQDELDCFALNADAVIGMGSILLLEIALKRNDVISYRPNDNYSFFGNNIGATTLIKSKNDLSDFLNGKIILDKENYENKFYGSTKRIVNFLMEIA